MTATIPLTAWCLLRCFPCQDISVPKHLLVKLECLIGAVTFNPLLCSRVYGLHTLSLSVFLSLSLFKKHSVVNTKLLNRNVFMWISKIVDRQRRFCYVGKIPGYTALLLFLGFSSIRVCERKGGG